MQGTGTFVPLEGAKPAIGQEGKLETVQEVRFESTPVDKVAAVIVSARPSYKRLVFDVVRHWTSRRCSVWADGPAQEPQAVEKLLPHIKEVTGAGAVVVGDPGARQNRGCCGDLRRPDQYGH